MPKVDGLKRRFTDVPVSLVVRWASSAGSKYTGPMSEESGARCPGSHRLLWVNSSSGVYSATFYRSHPRALQRRRAWSYVASVSCSSPRSLQPKFHYADFPVTSATNTWRGSRRNGIWAKGDVTGLLHSGIWPWPAAPWLSRTRHRHREVADDTRASWPLLLMLLAKHHFSPHYRRL